VVTGEKEETVIEEMETGEMTGETVVTEETEVIE
jgi:hypothetical protein